MLQQRDKGALEFIATCFLSIVADATKRSHALQSTQAVTPMKRYPRPARLNSQGYSSSFPRVEQPCRIIKQQLYSNMHLDINNNN
jgi:hypothetical protein